MLRKSFALLGVLVVFWFASWKDADAGKRAVVVTPLTEAGGGISSGDSFYRQGYRYSIGEGVPQDDAKAVLWYRKAAKQGHAGAQYNLGAAYANGTGVETNKATAVDLFFKAGQTFLSEGNTGRALQAAAAIERLAPGHTFGKQLLAAIQAQSQ